MSRSTDFSRASTAAASFGKSSLNLASAFTSSAVGSYGAIDFSNCSLASFCALVSTGATTGSTTGATTGSTTGATTGSTTGATTGSTTGATTGSTTGATVSSPFSASAPAWANASSNSFSTFSSGTML